MPRNRVALILALAATLAAGTAVGEDRHMHAFAQDVDALHAVLAPLWHAKPGSERSRNTCAQVQRLEQLTREVRSGNPNDMLASISALKVQCEVSPADIDAALSTVHEAFHRLAESKTH